MQIFSYSNKKEVLNANGATGNLLAQTKNNDYVELQIEENGFIPAHTLDIDVSFYVISGKGIVCAGTEEQQLMQGDMIHVEKNLDRSWKNIDNQLLKVLVIKQKN